MSSPVTRARRPALFMGVDTSVAAPPCQMIFRSATRVPVLTVMTTSAITARSSCLRSA